ncbi:MAG: hypothetical protein V1874_13880 [Spirochaetota bacterium]
MSFKTISCYFASVLLVCCFYANAYAAMSDKEYFSRISELAEKGKADELAKSAQNFFKEHPESGLIADVRLILAENEQDAGKALLQYRTLVDKYRYFKKRDLAQYKICAILYLQSKWSALKTEAQKGAELFKESGYFVQYRIFLAKAYIHLEQFDAAKKVCLEITKMNHDYNILSETLILLSYTNKNIYGLSRSYLYSLNEIITGFKNSSSMPAALVLLGRYYKSKGEYNKAFSAFSDVTAKFPRSPEAEFANTEIASIEQHRPVKTNYMPDKEMISKTDSIDIHPEMDDENANPADGIQYSISLGPFDKIGGAREIKNLVGKDFQPVEIAQTRNGYVVYAGRFAEPDAAIKTKIRLAEEFGMNGTIVKLVKDTNKLYIYEE